MSDNQEELHEEPVPEVKLPERPEGEAAPAEAPAVAPADGHAPRVARSVSNKPLIDESQAREHAESKAKASGGIKVRPAVRRGTPRARRMNLSLTRLNVWSVAKVSFMMSIAGALIQIVAAALVWLLLNAVGVFDQITQIVASTGLNADGFNLAQVFSLPTVLSAVTIFSIVEIVLLTILAVVVAAIYNVVSSLVGGVHVTLGDD
ncbi:MULTISPECIES: DUF3566 domain-containing protein [Bifidobacterium]|uniref:Membrane protein n=2 Tax=Bifidobacterium TaxID=1678 RepID=A0A087E0W0_9BIFI|nr:MULTISPECIES: DUF3566 domain-containing protein [Bifidobacterium]KFJ01411.1 membrane protein [Bifidobacterium stellenboschense]PLS28850.1 hypothetical protein Uis4E_0993 [Bifidobacterium parmae]